MICKLAVPVLASVGLGLLLSAAVLPGDAAMPPATSAGGQTARLTAALDNRSNTIKELEAARASAEADLREAIHSRPFDEALVRSLTAELVGFAHQLVEDEERMQSQLDGLLDPARLPVGASDPFVTTVAGDSVGSTLRHPARFATATVERSVSRLTSAFISARENDRTSRLVTLSSSPATIVILLRRFLD